MKWFGETWHAPVNDICERTPYPLDTVCGHCGNPILNTDRDLLMPYLAPDEVTDQLAFHIDCFLDMIGIGRNNRGLYLSRQ